MPLYQSITDYIEATRGTRNWIVAYRKTPRIVRRYGEGVLVLHPVAYQKIMREYDAQFKTEKKA